MKNNRHFLSQKLFKRVATLHPLSGLPISEPIPIPGATPPKTEEQDALACNGDRTQRFRRNSRTL